MFQRAPFNAHRRWSIREWRWHVTIRSKFHATNKEKNRRRFYIRASLEYVRLGT